MATATAVKKPVSTQSVQCLEQAKLYLIEANGWFERCKKDPLGTQYAHTLQAFQTTLEDLAKEMVRLQRDLKLHDEVD